MIEHVEEDGFTPGHKGDSNTLDSKVAGVVDEELEVVEYLLRVEDKESSLIETGTDMGKLRISKTHVRDNKAHVKVQLSLLCVFQLPVFETGVCKDVANEYFVPYIIKAIPDLSASRKLRS